MSKNDHAGQVVYQSPRPLLENCMFLKLMEFSTKIHIYGYLVFDIQVPCVEQADHSVRSSLTNTSIKPPSQSPRMGQVKLDTYTF